MDIDIEVLKKKYRKKTQVDLADLVQLQTMVPMLVREVIRLEDELGKVSQYIKHLEKQKPPSEVSGKLRKAQWLCRYNVNKNRVLIQVKGVFDAKSAKKASNAIISVLNHVGQGFDLINDISELQAIADMRTAFHMKKTRFHLVQAGVVRTVRVVPKKENTATVLFEKFFKEGSDIMVTHSLEDAESALDNQGKFLNS